MTSGALSAGAAPLRPAQRRLPARRLWRGAALALLLHVAMLLAALAWFRALRLPAAPESPAIALIAPPRLAAPLPPRPPVPPTSLLPRPPPPVPAAALPPPPPPAPLLQPAALPPRRPPPIPLPAATPASPLSLAAPAAQAPVAPAAPTSTAPTSTAPTLAAPTPTAPSGATRPPQPAGAGNAPPVYPALSRVLGEQGRVRLEIRVTAAGVAAGVAIAGSSGFTRLDNAALAAAVRWRFQPALRSGQPVAAVLPLWITFRLR